MKSAIYKTTILTLLLTCTCAAVIFGCRSVKGESESDSIPDGVVAIPHGYMARLEQVHDGRMIGFGPFVGYYFRPETPRDLSRLSFVCFNEKRFYSSDMPDSAKLYEGTALLVTLPSADIVIPPPRTESIRYFFRKHPRSGVTPGRSLKTNLYIFTPAMTVPGRC